MIIEERIYTLKPGALAQYRALYLEHGYELQKSILGNLIGYYVTEFGPQNQVIHLWGYESHDERDRRRAELFSNPDWLDYIKSVAPLVETQENKLLKPLVP